MNEIYSGIREAVRGIGVVYHFVDQKIGNRQSPEIVTKLVQGKIDTVRKLASDEGVVGKGLTRIAKAVRVLPKMQQALELLTGALDARLTNLHSQMH